MLSLGVEKTQESSASLWRAAQELVDGDNVYGEESEEQVCIKKIAWLAPQPPSTEGCLFILLGNYTSTLTSHSITSSHSRQTDRQIGRKV